MKWPFVRVQCGGNLKYGSRSWSSVSPWLGGRVDLLVQEFLVQVQPLSH